MKRPSIGFSEEQTQLLEVATAFCRDKSPVENVRRLLEDERGYDESVWQEIVDLGWLGVAVPEAYDGAGLGLAEVVPIVEQMGRNLLTTPFIGTTLAAQIILANGNEAQKTEYLPKFCAGSVGTLALSEAHGDWDLTHVECKAERIGERISLSGNKVFVENAADADFIIVSAVLEKEPALLIVGKQDLQKNSLYRESLIDETRRSCRLCLDNITVPATSLMDTKKTREALSHIDLAETLLLSAEMCGGAARIIEYTVDYLKNRKQFGKVIGSYQALKHPVVDAHVAYEQARSHLYYAASHFLQQGESEIATRMAKAQAGEAFSFAADRAIQFHGGFGFTYDCDAQLFRRRSLYCESRRGDGAYQRKKLADLLL